MHSVMARSWLDHAGPRFGQTRQLQQEAARNVGNADRRSAARGADSRRFRHRLRGAAGRRSGRFPGQVPQDGGLGLRLLPGHGLPVLRRPGAGAARRPVPGRAHRPGVDPRRSARGELRHLHGRQRPPRLQRQRLRRGVRGPLHLGPEALRRLRGADRLREGAGRRADQRAGDGLRRLLPRADPRAGDGREERRGAAVHAGHRGRPAAGRAPRRPVAHAFLAAGLDDGDPGLRAPVHGRRRVDRPGRRDTLQGAGRVRRLSGDAAGVEPDPPRLLPGQGRGGPPGHRHRVRRPPRTTSSWRATATPWRTMW